MARHGATMFGAATDPLRLFAGGIKGFWLDPSDFTTMWTDSAGTTPVAAAGDAVGRIADKSGNGLIFTQASASSRPLLQQDAGGRWYLDFDGSNDSLSSTATLDLTGTDKVTHWTGIRKANDAVTFGIVLELGNRGITQAGSLSMTAPASGATLFFALEGSAKTDYTASTYTAPISLVTSCVFDVGGAARATEIFPRVNQAIPGTLTGGATADAGTGNFGNRTVFIGRRNESSLPFSGRMYSQILRGATSDAATIASIENWVNGKTGAY